MLKEFIAFIKEQESNFDSIQIAEVLWFVHQVSPLIKTDDSLIELSELEKLRKFLTKQVSIFPLAFLLQSKLNRLTLIFLKNRGLNRGKLLGKKSRSPTYAVTLPRPNKNQKQPLNQKTPSFSQHLPIKLPDTGLFRNTLVLGRLAKPLKRKINSRIIREIDIQATVKQSAELSTPKFPSYFPILTPKKERWLDVALLIEDSDSMLLWQSLFKEVQDFLEHLGAFRDIKSYKFKWDDSERALRISSMNYSSYFLSPSELKTSDRRRLILIISDGLSKAWIRDKFAQILKFWSQEGLLTLLNPFPETMWERTNLDYGIRIRLANQKKGRPTQQWQAIPIEPWQAKKIKQQNLVKLPILSLEPESMTAWINAIIGKGTSFSAGVWLGSNFMYPDCDKEDEDQYDLSPAQQINYFYASSSQLAWELIQWLSAIPLNLATISLVQRTLLPAESTQVNIAEVIMGGLLTPCQPLNLYKFPSQIQFEFKEGIREEFLERLGREKFCLGVLGSLSEKIASHFGYQTVRQFEAILLNKPWELSRDGDDGDHELIQAFAMISLSTLKQYGKEYTSYLQKLEKSYHTLNLIPELERFEFIAEVATIAFEEDNDRDRVELLEWEFETPTVDRRGETLKTTTYTASYFTETLTDKVQLEMVAIPGGTFTMGSPKDEKGSSDRERPQHEVKISPFFIGKYPVTQSQWRAIATLTDLKQKRDLKPDPSNFKGDDRPVERVNWYEAVEFCQRLSKLTGREYRLPSEAEWEYACRGVSEPLDLEKGESYPPFYFGETLTGQLANYRASSTYADEPKGEDRNETTLVGQFPPNAFGLYDLHGNVWEWCADEWHENYLGAPDDGSAWLNGNKYRSPLRGGAWNSNPDNCRSASRDLDYRFYGDDDGFRIVCGFGRTH